MTDAERLLRRLGATPLRSRRHKVFVLDGVRFTLHGGTRPNPAEIFKVRKQLVRMGRLPG